MIRPTSICVSVSLLMLAACSGGGTPPEHSEATGPGSLTSSAPPGGQTSTRTDSRTKTLPCGDFIDTHAPIDDLEVVLGVVALPTSPGAAALQTFRTGDTNPATRLFAKTGLVIKADSTFELVAAGPSAASFSIGWGNPGHRGRRIVVQNCQDPAGSTGWLAYAGGYWTRDPKCVSLLVKAHGQEQRVHIGLGTACPGQQPPTGPSQS